MKALRDSGMSLIEVIIAGAILGVALLLTIRQLGFTSRALTATNTSQAADAVEEQIANNLLVSITAFYRRVGGPGGTNCMVHQLPATGPPANLPAVPAADYLSQMVAAASTSLINLAVIGPEYPLRSGTVGEVERQNLALRRCRTGQTMRQTNFKNAPGFYFCAALSPAAPNSGVNMPGDLAISSAFGEFLYSMRNWNGDGTQNDPIRCRQMKLSQPRVSTLYYTLYWMTTAAGGPIYHETSGQVQGSDASPNAW